MKSLHRLLAVASAAFFFASAALAQTSGTVTNHAFLLGKGAGQTGFTSLLCGSAQLAVGQSAADPICRSITGDVTLSAAGAITLATVNSNVGSFGSTTQCVSFTVNAKGLITAASAATCAPAVGSITGLGTGVATALGINIGSAGAFITFNGALGTPSSGTLTNATGLPISTGVSGLGTGCATFLGTPSSANLRGCLTDEVGTGAAYFVGGALGTPASGTATNLTGLPLSGLTAQAAWSFVVNNTSGSAFPTAVDIPSFTLKASPAASDLIVISDQAASGALKRATVSSIASAGSVASWGGLTGAIGATYPIGVSGSNAVFLGQVQSGYLSYSSSTSIKFNPDNGDMVRIAGVVYQIPSAGVDCGNPSGGVFLNGTGSSSLSTSTTYYVYIFNNSGTLACDFSTTAYAVDSTAGNIGTYIKSAVASRSLIGMVRIGGSVAYTNSAKQRFVVSWFNRKHIHLTNNLTSTTTQGTSCGAGPTPTFGEVSSSVRIEFLAWSGIAVQINILGSFFNSGANTNIASIGIDGTTGEDVFAVMTGTSAQPLAVTHHNTYSEGYHYATILNCVSAGTASYYVFGNAAGGRTTIKGLIQG